MSGLEQQERLIGGQGKREACQNIVGVMDNGWSKTRVSKERRRIKNVCFACIALHWARHCPKMASMLLVKCKGVANGEGTC